MIDAKGPPDHLLFWHLMNGISKRFPDMDTSTYNRIFEAVSNALNEHRTDERKALERVEKITWREGATLKDAQKALWDIRREITRYLEGAK